MNQGNIAQYRLMAFLTERGYMLSLPCDPTCPYDLIVDNGQRLIKVQIKSCNVLKRNRYKADIARGSQGKIAYTQGEFDLLAVLAANDWYFIPLDVVLGQKWISLYPHTMSGKYEPYRNTWEVLNT
jgi:hypothetical protein